MADIKTVGVKDLKNNLSAHLRDVKRGTRILVADRDRVVAELHEPSAPYTVAGGDNPVLERWVREGKVRLPTRPRGPMESTGLKSPAGTAARLLDETRRERWEDPS
jgi:antitoxin (DNA-binding transcriptional repressor) of toxin-antitoxin stability system